jgi:hypothetical protein
VVGQRGFHSEGILNGAVAPAQAPLKTNQDELVPRPKAARLHAHSACERTHNSRRLSQHRRASDRCFLSDRGYLDVGPRQLPAVCLILPPDWPSSTGGGDVANTSTPSAGLFGQRAGRSRSAASPRGTCVQDRSGPEPTLAASGRFDLELRRIERNQAPVRPTLVCGCVGRQRVQWARPAESHSVGHLSRSFGQVRGAAC